MAVFQKTTGEYNKFYVNRVDQRDNEGGDRHGAEYLVLDLTYDKYAYAGLIAYAEAVEAEYPLFAADLFKRAYHPEYPFIFKACFEVTMDNGGLNRDRSMEQIKKEYADFIATFAARYQNIIDLDALNLWFKSLTKEQMDIATAGEETEMEEFMKTGPDGGLMLLYDWFEEHC